MLLSDLMEDPFDLERFVRAQSDAYDAALAEIRRGSKRSHWMWLVFPQVAGLGTSETARRYALRSLAEARAYLAHDVLGPRLRESVGAVQDLVEADAEAVFGQTDAAKFRSSLTLFREAGGGALFQAALDRWFGGSPDAATLRLLSG